MRTLKKVLALSMVFAMAFSMMAGAAFNDQDQIDASLVEDIQLLTALEVFQGDENGDFNPTANVTRAQAAKMIYVLKNNGVDDEAAAFKGTSVYSDVPSGHWAEGYINYATNLGIMSGWTEGSVRKFDPNGNVTGVELTKMLLCMIGYRADIQGYTGNGWQTNVLKDGAASAITTNYLPTIYNAAPRQWTARLMANAINAPYASYSRGELVTGSATEPTRSYGRQYLGLEMVEGYLKDAGKVALPALTANGSTSLDDDGEEIVVCTTYENNNATVAARKDLAAGGISFKTTVDPMMLGQHVKVYYKNTNTTTREYKVYAVLPTGKSKVYDMTLADVTAGQNDNGETLKFTGYNGGSAKTFSGHVATTVKDDSNASNYNPGIASDSTGNDIVLIKNLDTVELVKPLQKNKLDHTTGNSAPDWASVKNFGVFAGNSNEAIRFVDQDGDGIIDLALSNKVDYAIVTSHNSAKNSIRFESATGSNLKLVDGDNVGSETAYKKINFVNDVVADDVVKVTLDTTSGQKVWNVEKVEPTTGSVSGYTLSGNNYNNITLNGESTKIAKAGYMMAGYDRSAVTNTSLLNDTTFYTDGKYIVYSKGGDSVASVGNLAYIIATDKYESFGKNTVYVKALLSDGTQGQYEVAATYELMDKATDGTTLNNNRSSDGVLVKTDVANVSGGVKDSLIVENTVMSYSISNGKITLSQLKNDKAATGIKFADGTLGYNRNANRLTGATSNVIAEEAYFFVVSNVKGTTAPYDYSDAKYNVVKGSELGKDLTGLVAGTYATKTVNNIPSVVFGTMTIQNNAVATAADYAFVKSAASYAAVDGDYVAQMTVVLPNGEEQVIKKTYTTSSGALSKVQDWNDLRGKVVSYDLDADGDVDGDPTVITVTALPGTLEDGHWYSVRIRGWNTSNASVDNGTAITESNNGNAQVLNVASDVKIHAVNTTDESYGVYVSDGSVSETAKNDETGNFENQVSALIYVEKNNDTFTITDIFAEEDGAAIGKLHN